MKINGELLGVGAFVAVLIPWSIYIWHIVQISNRHSQFIAKDPRRFNPFQGKALRQEHEAADPEAVRLREMAQHWSKMTTRTAIIAFISLFVLVVTLSYLGWLDESKPSQPTPMHSAQHSIMLFQQIKPKMPKAQAEKILRGAEIDSIAEVDSLGKNSGAITRQYTLKDGTQYAVGFWNDRVWYVNGLPKQSP